MASTKKLTDYEIRAWSHPGNYADGHAKYPFWNSALLDHSHHTEWLLSEFDQEEEEIRFARRYFDIAGESTISTIERLLYVSSASLSIEIIANYLRLEGMSVSLLHPTFDNLADIMKRHKLDLRPIEEDVLHTHLESHLLTYSCDTDAIFLVLPNNPTGWSTSEEEFGYLVEHCQRNDKLLILDFSFRFYSMELLSWSQYDVLDRSGIRYVALEDTGKTWPTNELKISLLRADPLTYEKLTPIYRDLFICASPVALAFISTLLEHSLELGLVNTVLPTCARNRQLLHDALLGSPFIPMSIGTVPIEWIQCPAGVASQEIEERLRSEGVFVLPGHPFFWNDPPLGDRFFRIALMRDPIRFANDMLTVASVLKDTAQGIAG